MIQPPVDLPTMAGPFNLAAAEAYVLANGNPRQVAYWKAAFGWGPVETWLFEMETFQGPLGGWGNFISPGVAGRVDRIAGTAAALRWLAWVSLGEDVFEVLPRTLAYLAERQDADGSWCDPDEPVGRASDTAAIGAYLAFMGEVPERVEAAARWVVANVGAAHPDIWPVFTGWLLALLRGRPLEGAEALVASAYEALAGAVAKPERSTGELAWVHESLVMAGLPSSDPLRARIVGLLGDRQLADGSFFPDDPAWDAVDTTFFAARALVTR